MSVCLYEKDSGRSCGFFEETPCLAGQSDFHGAIEEITKKPAPIAIFLSSSVY